MGVDYKTRWVEVVATKRIIAKVVASRLSPMLNKMLMPHQHGLIKGRSIYDNILAAMVGIDYAKISH